MTSVCERRIEHQIIHIEDNRTTFAAALIVDSISFPTYPPDHHGISGFDAPLIGGEPVTSQHPHNSPRLSASAGMRTR
jgi:hypothetical protein